jgi:predicted enzyme related to lactoylglutathione lyase
LVSLDAESQAIEVSPMAPQLNLLVIRSPDIDRAAAFYRVLGFGFERHAHGNGPVHYASEPNGFVFEIYPLKPNSAPTTAARLGFRVPSVDDVVRDLGEAGGQIVAAPADSEWGRGAVVKDPDGHVIELLAAISATP